ncbi:Molybdenum cofactor biosynthesis protein B [Planktothrix tepida]|uniref:Molybdenum cofactor biosynthesis protein B n=1 Tax=Planktothrix tepida PCC 9214 TaxID=671072 RepID=A0A1J1LP34_9CYAN|nr:MogA/MoaB family molybdenum cofactor biosynthesis protein [Planktothrix tepida]CAD5955336.1 Molybdenum cofactor biosynthesis protein B [Planktothrix tepida]CUR34175.1 Molybdenum cofactor biosynthesis protein B [Planktothrix tepida PCC 9214]
MNSTIPHPDSSEIQVNCAVITVSDTRTPETDKSGQLIQQFLQNAGYPIRHYQIVKDEPTEITELLKTLCQIPELDACIFNGGTGISPRDTTYDAIETLLEKTLPGFGEIFRTLSYAEIGSRAMASRAVAGVCQGKLIFSVPGSSNAVKLAMEQLIIPELAHLVKVLNQ